MLKVCLVLVALVTQDCASQEDEDGPYRGKFIGKLNSYHHQVSGEVYAVDEWTVVLVNFNYDGTGDDTFFWAGDAGRPGPQGFIVPDEHGKTNILERYINAEVFLRLPEGKRVSRIKWLCVYDIDSQNTFGDVYVADDFEAPAPRELAALAGPGLSSGPLRFLTATELLLPELRYDAAGQEVYFWTGVGPQPSAKGYKIPDEDGYLEPLRAYSGEDVALELPGGRTVFDINWVALYDRGAGRALASVLVPEGLNVPPSRTRLHPHRSELPSCLQLHRDLQVSWEVFGPQVTWQLAGRVGAADYMAWGISGDETHSRMVGADVAVVSWDGRQRRGAATDYNVTAAAPCVRVLGAWRGVCRDALLGGTDSNQVFTASREEGLTVVAWRRTLAPAEPMDREWATDKPVRVVWAAGRLDAAGEPALHALYPRTDLALNLSAQTDDCVPFAVSSRAAPAAWERAQLFDPAVRVLRFTLGPAGGARGRGARAGAGAGGALAWYVNGQLAPDLQLRRGLVYTFKVSGGNDPHSPTLYHPLVVTAEERGGVERMDEAAQGAARVLAGAAPTRRGRLAPLAAGAACEARLPARLDPRRLHRFATFRQFNRSLEWPECSAPPADLVLAPNSSWPDLVYYHSFTHPDMGGRIFVVDRHKRTLGRGESSSAAALLARGSALVAVTLAALLLLLSR